MAIDEIQIFHYMISQTSDSCDWHFSESRYLYFNKNECPLPAVGEALKRIGSARYSTSGGSITGAQIFSNGSGSYSYFADEYNSNTGFFALVPKNELATSTSAGTKVKEFSFFELSYIKKQ